MEYMDTYIVTKTLLTFPILSTETNRDVGLETSNGCVLPLIPLHANPTQHLMVGLFVSAWMIFYKLNTTY